MDKTNGRIVDVQTQNGQGGSDPIQLCSSSTDVRPSIPGNIHGNSLVNKSIEKSDRPLSRAEINPVILSPLQRRILELRGTTQEKGLTYNEIGDLLGYSHEHIRQELLIAKEIQEGSGKITSPRRTAVSQARRQIRQGSRPEKSK